VGAANGLALAGAALILVAAFLPGITLVGASGSVTLWEDGTGWPLVALALALGALTVRASRRGTWSWAALVVGLLAALDALGLARDDALSGLEAGTYVLALGALVTLAGWALGFVREPRAIEGIGPWPQALETLRRARPPDPAPARGRTRPWFHSPAVYSLAIYAVVSLAYFGWPVRDGFDSALIAENVLDPSAFTWFYEWWPHAIVHGHNPFVSQAIFAPEGYNLTWVTSVPGPSLLMAPVTLAFGPVVTYNVIAIAGPALSAWTAFLLCRHVSGRVVPSLLGGYAFGFSPHILRALEGSPTLYLVALVPALALLVLLRLEGRVSERALFAGFAVAVALEFLTSNDVLATMTVFGAVALAAGAALYVEMRPLIIRTAGVIAAGYAAAVVLVSPFIFFMLFREHTTPEQNSPFLANDIVSWIHPDSSLAIATDHGTGPDARKFGGLAYFGIPLLILVAAYLWESRRTRRGRLLAICFGAPLLAGLGHRLIVDGDITSVGTPWSLVDRLPGLHLLVPQRFPLYAFLAAAVMLSIWLARRDALGRWAVALLALAFMVPNVRGSFWNEPLATPAFFTGGDRGGLGAGDNVITIPIIGDNMRWHAESKFRFRIAGGGVGAFPESFTSYPAFNTLITNQVTARSPAQLRRFIRDKRVTAVVASKAHLSPDMRRLLATLGVRPEDTGGVLLYRLDGARAGGGA
jgi:hypothetical protein